MSHFTLVFFLAGTFAHSDIHLGSKFRVSQGPFSFWDSGLTPGHDNGMITLLIMGWDCGLWTWRLSSGRALWLQTVSWYFRSHWFKSQGRISEWIIVLFIHINVAQMENIKSISLLKVTISKYHTQFLEKIQIGYPSEYASVWNVNACQVFNRLFN